uniref:Uncharacterized protein n=3 Tax=Aegilops tauschii subsp. strangulata TaxID=200361 RepID=A0A453AZ38_AEGTS
MCLTPRPRPPHRSRSRSELSRHQSPGRARPRRRRPIPFETTPPSPLPSLSPSSPPSSPSHLLSLLQIESSTVVVAVAVAGKLASTPVHLGSWGGRDGGGEGDCRGGGKDLWLETREWGWRRKRTGAGLTMACTSRLERVPRAVRWFFPRMVRCALNVFSHTRRGAVDFSLAWCGALGA